MIYLRYSSVCSDSRSPSARPRNTECHTVAGAMTTITPRTHEIHPICMITLFPGGRVWRSGLAGGGCESDCRLSFVQICTLMLAGFSYHKGAIAPCIGPLELGN